MAGKKKFGAFAGVFTPSILTILGVIMYMRMGWVVGNAGLIGTLVIVTIAHIISLSTGLSVSSIATDKKVGAGGIYYILSRSMGIPIGGAIGITLYVGTALSIALYLVGFAESFNGYFDLDVGINGIRMSGSIALLILTIIALISTSVALKTQFFILIAIIISLVSIFFGTSEFVPQEISLFSDEKSVSMELVFAIFFPAVTGFTAGIAMSGDLKDPKKAIPYGTLAAIAVGFVVYIALTIFIATYVNSDALRSDNNILLKIAYYGPAVVIGIWGATLSSALGGILGGPRILQAMSIDKITPRIFGKGKGKNNEPVNALILVFVIAQLGVLIGELDVIARVVSMFYLAAYGFINLSFFLESWANPDFQPTFKVKRWIGLIGFIACFGVMFKLDMIAMFASIIIIMGIYFWLHRKRIMLDTGDVWQSVWGNVVAKGLKKLENNEASLIWNPNIILFSGSSEVRPHLLGFSKTVSGRTGIVTNFNLIIKDKDVIPLSKVRQTIKDDVLEELGIFGRRIEVNNIYDGVLNVASTFGFSGVDPNTIMMGWPKRSSNPEAYAQMTENLIHLDYNLLYLDYDVKSQFGNYKTIDFWWRETDNNNAELMLNIARFIVQSPKWSDAKIRILFVNHNNVDNNIIRSRIKHLSKELRVETEIVIINNGVEQKPFYEIIERQSANSDLIVLGIPDINIEKQAQFILNTNKLFDNIGSTLLVKASRDFNEIQLDFSYEKISASKKSESLKPLPLSESAKINELINEFDVHLSKSLNLISKPSLNSIASFYCQFFDSLKNDLENIVIGSDKDLTQIEINDRIKSYLNRIKNRSNSFKEDKIVTLNELFNSAMHSFVNDRNAYIQNAPVKISFEFPVGSNIKKTVRWKTILKYFKSNQIISNTEHCLYEYGVKCFYQISHLAEKISNETKQFIENESSNSASNKLVKYSDSIKYFIEESKNSIQQLDVDFNNKLNEYERNLCLDLFVELESSGKPIYKTGPRLKKRRIKECENNILNYSMDWQRNQVLAHNHFEAELKLCISSCSLIETNNRMLNHINGHFVSKQLEDLKALLKAVRSIEKSLGTKLIAGSNIKIVQLLSQKVGYDLFKELIHEEEEKLMISGDSEDIQELMSAESNNVLYKIQNENVSTIPLDISNIERHIIQSSYLLPLQNSFLELEKIYIENAEEIYNSANLIQHVVEESEDKENINNYKSVIIDVVGRLELCYNAMERQITSFQQDVINGLHDTVSALNMDGFIESSDSLSKAAQKPVLKTSLQKWYLAQKALSYRNYRALIDFVIQRRQDIDTLQFEEKHHQYQNIIEQTNSFIQKISINPVISNQLPYYYKKIFTGGHLNNANLGIREREMKLAQNAIHRINEGVSGGIMILGTSGSGKTYFSDMISRSINNELKYNIDIPTSQRFNKTDMHKAFRKTFGMKGTTEVILSKLENKSVLIFNDIERWWVNAEGGNAVINYISELIENYGHRFYFILNCNIHSFDIIRKTSNLERKLLSTIIMSPVNKFAIRDIILNRHKTSGMNLYYDGNIVQNSGKLEGLFSNIQKNSNGTIGVALNNWISNIAYAEDQLVIRKISNELIFPHIYNSNWKLILYQLLIHNRLTNYHIQHVFDEQEKNRIENVLNEMVSSGLVRKEANSTFVLDKAAKHYIMLWYKKLNILD